MTSSYLERVLARRSRQKHRAVGNPQAALGPPTSYQEKLLSKRGHLIHKLKAKDTTGKWAYYFVYVPKSREKSFLKAIEGDGTIDLEDYGMVVGSCYGEEPSDFLKQELKRKYGFEV